MRRVWAVAAIVGWALVAGVVIAAFAGVGPSGAQGAKGPTGAAGETGAASTVAGPVGPIGPKGGPGDKGARGGSATSFASPHTDVLQIGTFSSATALCKTQGEVVQGDIATHPGRWIQLANGSYVPDAKIVTDTNSLPNC